jgi:hypothetical protein
MKLQAIWSKIIYDVIKQNNKGYYLKNENTREFFINMEQFKLNFKIVK